MIRSVAVKPIPPGTVDDAIVIPLFAGRSPLGSSAKRLNRSTHGSLSAAIKQGRASAARGSSFMLTIPRAGRIRALLLVGAGKPSELSAEVAADVGGRAAHALDAARFSSAAIILEGLDDTAAETFVGAFVKGFTLALYRYRLSAHKPKLPSVKRLTVYTDADRSRIRHRIRHAMVAARFATSVRDLVNTPANILTPSAFTSRARAMANENSLTCRVAGRAELEKKKVGALLAVGQGSNEAPRMVTVHYNRGSGLPLVCLVGKGVTFDTGGISLKPWDKMNEMKGDMAGAAVVLGTICAASRLKIPLEIVGVMPVVENMPDANAFRPGDVLTTYSGKTIEVLSTDAEGRLILADALTWVKKNYRPIVTVDFATLTGAVLVALGTRIAGIMGNSQPDIDEFVAAGIESGEPVWQLPLDEPFYEEVRGDITDYKNVAGKYGSTITAGALLGHFAGKAPWVHVDIAGTSWKSSTKPTWQTGGATGYGIDLTLSYLERVARRANDRGNAPRRR